MYLSHLTLSHFRSHRLARIETDARPVAVYGVNGVGKTNLLEAVSLFSPGRGLRRASAAEMARRPESLGWKITGMLHQRGNGHEIAFSSEDGGSRKVQINDKTGSQIDLGQLCRVVWLVPSMDRLWIEGAEGRRRFLDRMTLSFFPEHAQAALDYEKAMRERNRLLRDQIRDAHWYRALEHQMAQTGVLLHKNRTAALQRLLQAQDGAATAFPIAELELVQSEGSMPETEADFAKALEESRFRDIAVGRSLVGPHRTDLQGVFAAKGVPAAECSTGEQKALLISLILANARALAQDIGDPPLVLLDEVAAHLDRGRREALYDEICALGAQAWMTGTDLDLFSELGTRAQYIEVTEKPDLALVLTEQ